MVLISRSSPPSIRGPARFLNSVGLLLCSQKAGPETVDGTTSYERPEYVDPSHGGRRGNGAHSREQPQRPPPSSGLIAWDKISTNSSIAFMVEPENYFIFVGF